MNAYCLFSRKRACPHFLMREALARYAGGPVRQVPGFHGLQTMARLLLAEKVPPRGEVLVLGAYAA